MGIHHWAANEDEVAHLSLWQLCLTPPISMLTGCLSGDSSRSVPLWVGDCDEYVCAQQCLQEP